MLKIGDKAPDFSLHCDTGATVSLKDFAGKHVVLFFFPKANTPG
jgi:thioredoxin-dependent peroxiredoxin